VAFNAVVEPQVDGRLHVHMTIYATGVNPSLLARSPELVRGARQYLSAVSCTTTTNDARMWCQAHEGKMARAFQVEVPSACYDYDGFLRAAERRVMSTNTHSHSQHAAKGYAVDGFAGSLDPLGFTRAPLNLSAYDLKRLAFSGSVNELILM
ncbi:hypothetical protein L915_11154, partial [Phytophthora nicotianae]